MAIVQIPNPAIEFPEGATPYTLRWFRNGIVPPGVAAKRLAEHLNILLTQRGRAVMCHTGSFTQDANTGGVFEGFDTESNSDLTTYRAAFHTGPTTTRLRARFAALRPDKESTATSSAYVEMYLRTGLTGDGTVSSLGPIYTPGQSTLSDQFALDEIYEWEQVIGVSPDTDYRIEVHQVNRARLVSCSIWESTSQSIDTAIYPVVIDPSTFRQGDVITDDQMRQLMLAADTAWRIGQPLFHWTADVAASGTNLPHEPRSRTSATAANLLDQSYTAYDAAAPGFYIDAPYSGTLGSSNIPVVFWCYASCTSGTGSVVFKDQAGVTLATITPSGAAAWYSTTGNLTDASGTETTEVQVLFAGDATNSCVVHAVGAFVYSGTAVGSGDTGFAPAGLEAMFATLPALWEEYEYVPNPTFSKGS